MAKKRQGNKDDSKPQKKKKTDCFENDQNFAIEEIFARFPNLSQGIFDRLDDRSLVSCREVSKTWRGYVDSQRIYWIRKILKYNNPQSKFHSEWKIVLDKTPIESLKKFARYVLLSSKESSPIYVAGVIGDVALFNSVKEKTGLSEKSKGNDGMTPFHIAAYNNHLNLCKVIIEQLQDKNPGNIYGVTPLHYAAMRGHLRICTLIMKSVQDKNPGNKGGGTPLHFAAQFGHYYICYLMMDKLDDKNPRDCNGCTPLHEAASSGHVHICRLIYEMIASTGWSLHSLGPLKRVYGRNPGNNKGVTPLHFAARHGHVEVCKFLCLNLKDKNPKGEKGITPLHVAAKHGQLDVCKWLCSNLADKNPKDDNDKTPIDHAYSTRQLNIVRFLIDENNFTWKTSIFKQNITYTLQ